MESLAGSQYDDRRRAPARPGETASVVDYPGTSGHRWILCTQPEAAQKRGRKCEFWSRSELIARLLKTLVAQGQDAQELCAPASLPSIRSPVRPRSPAL